MASFTAMKENWKNEKRSWWVMGVSKVLTEAILVMSELTTNVPTIFDTTKSINKLKNWFKNDERSSSFEFDQAKCTIIT
jgi:hypothetical protein